MLKNPKFCVKKFRVTVFTSNRNPKKSGATARKQKSEPQKKGLDRKFSGRTENFPKKVFSKNPSLKTFLGHGSYPSYTDI